MHRTPARRPLVGIVTSTDLLGTMTHYFKGRTMPCDRPECEACAKGQPYRWHAYMSALDVNTALHFLFEVTAQAAENFVQYREAHLTLRGCKFKATRWRANPNGRVLIQCKPADLHEISIPPSPDLLAVLSILWNLPSNGAQASVRDSQENTLIPQFPKADPPPSGPAQ